MRGRLLSALALLPLLGGCFTPMVAEAIKGAGERPVRRVKTHATHLRDVVRSRDGRYFIDAVYSDGARRRFVYETYRGDGPWPGATFRPMDMESYPRTHAFPSACTPIPIWVRGADSGSSCVRLLASHLQLRQGNAEFVSVARFPTFTHREYGSRSAISYFHQVCLSVFCLPLAVAGDIVTFGLLAAAHRRGPPGCD